MPRLVPIVLLASVAAAAGGCLDASTRKKVADNGILALVAPPSPAEAAQMMADPFDADRRYKGVTWISNAPWGGADVYLRAYREMVQTDPDIGVRAVAARALAFHGAPADAMLIVPLLKNEDPRVRQTAARALQRLHNPAVIPHLLPLVDQNERSTVRILTTATEAEAIAARARVLGPGGMGDAARFAAAATQVSKHESAANGGLLGEMGGYDNSLPQPVWQMVARTPPGLVTPVMPIGSGFGFLLVETRTQGELDHDTRQAAASALGQYADPRVLNTLVGALNDDDLAVSRTARESLRTLTGVDEGDKPERWQAWASAASNPFAGQRRYTYPNFERDKYLWEYIPLVPPPPNEPASTPIGYRPPGS
ncbi:MAG TPA: HEAT repeat domain-containing protein [Phycisphaerales bacterium]|nr:HEAT repeat domain-containing protein [Phycisphaerales bacterium]